MDEAAKIAAEIAAKNLHGFWHEKALTNHLADFDEVPDGFAELDAEGHHTFEARMARVGCDAECVGSSGCVGED